MSPPGVLNGFRPVSSALPRLRSVLIVVADGFCIVVACLLAFLLRFEFAIPDSYLRLLAVSLGVFVLAKLAAFALVRLHRTSWRYFSLHDLLFLAAGNVIGSVAAVCGLIWFSGAFPRSVAVIDLVLCFLATAAPRVGFRMMMETAKFPAPRKGRSRTVIYGAGAAGIALLREIRHNPALDYDICGFVDDSGNHQGVKIQGVPVLGPGSALSSIASRHAFDLVLIAIPSATGPQMSRILEHCHSAGVAFKTIPGLAEVIEEKGLARQLRDVAVDDLLGRSPVRLEQERISNKLENRVILVTGAAGSIGSELCRQIARFRPSAIVGYDAAETPLFHLEHEMARVFPDVRFIPVIGTVQSPHRLAEVFGLYRPSVVYHAAAYKHVPMMEAHAFEAVENNVFGTLNVALAAENSGVSDFVMISSDKAVRPTNVMGATKRLAELVIRSLQNGSVKFVSVRFGNVLGSNGSVVPIFKRQIASGGPVTVTHPEMRRYFMTIPEACQLVLQSSTMGHGGEIFVLDMGEPVRIVDLARNLILLSGLRPDHDIKIEFTGIRPGEKLYEELSALGEDTLPTYHEKIKIFAGATVPWPEMEARLEDLRAACADRSLESLVLTMKDLVPEYNPSSDLLRRVLSPLSRPQPPVLAASVGD